MELAIGVVLALNVLARLPLAQAVWKQPFRAKRLLPAGLFRAR
jgi:hypothetical protein